MGLNSARKLRKFGSERLHNNAYRLKCGNNRRKYAIDTTVFKAHSVLGAVTTAASNAGVTLGDTLDVLDWSNPICTPKVLL